MDEVSQSLGATDAMLTNLIQGAYDTTPVSGLTHKFYRYPARFSPNFVRAAIHAFSKPGDWVLDPFAGGGTTLVEAVAHGRHALGVDISSLATFICEAKTLVLDDHDIRSIRHWANKLIEIINMRASGRRFASYAEAGYYRNLEGHEYWRLRKAIEQVLATVIRLRRPKAQTLARCILLKTAQWALDSRKSLPSVQRFREEIVAQADIMIDATIELKSRVKAELWQEQPKAICLNRSAAGIENDPKITRIGAPKLIVTSPPYPGVHVLYHRWQVDGRKETPAPFWIADRLDGAGLSYYALGERKCPELRTYFENLEAVFRSIAQVCDPETVVVQMVAFSDPKWQLPKYLEVMESCGLEEYQPQNFQNLHKDGRLWRKVPNRKWYARQKEKSHGSREVVLIHRKAS